jgi:glycosyltransferase involved in cell wall biosynthesis
MRILMISDFYSPFIGGVEVLVRGVSRELTARGHSVAVATLARLGSSAREHDDGVVVYRIRTTSQRVGRLFTTPARPWAPPMPDPEAVLGLRSVLQRVRPDVVHGHDWLARSYLPLKRPRRGPAFVMSLHYYTLSCPKKSLMYRGSPCSGPALAKCLGCATRHYGAAKGTAVVLGQLAWSHSEAAKVDLFLPVTAATAQGNGVVMAGLPYEVMPNMLPREAELGPHASLLDQLPREPFLLFVGDIRRDKGVDVLLDAYRALRDPPPLVLIGKVWGDTPGELPDGASLLRDWPNVAVRAAMRRSLALVMPSIWPEPFGIVAAEALAAGRPVVASAIGGIPEIVRDEGDGLLVAPGDAAALTRALARVVHDKTLRESLARNARVTADRLMPEAVVPRIEAAYRRAIAEAARR